MSRLEQLIEKFCPNGVEFRYIWEVTAWDKRFNIVDDYKQKKIIKYTYYLSSDLKELVAPNGTVKILTTNKSDLWANEDDVVKTLSDGEIVCIPWGGNPIVQYYKGKFVTGDNRIATSLNVSILDNKFLYYCMQNKLEDIASFYRGSGIKHPNMSKVLDIQIPIPPLPVQNEIVRILDNFTELTVELTAELTAEFTARKKQYEYYRDSILENNDYPCKTLGELCKFVRGPFGGALKKECFKNSGYAVYEQQHAIYSKFEFRYYISEEKFNELRRFEVFPNDLIMSCSGTMGKIAIIPFDAPRGIINQALLKLTPNNNVNAKYLKYCFESSIAKQMNDNARGGAIKNVASVDVLKKIEVKLPTLSDQQRIVDILDRFDILCNDISKGLPAEIRERQKQYEYYRNKLLTFKNKNVEV